MDADPLASPADTAAAPATTRTLYVLRHAKSDWTAGVSRDFDRPLNARGRRGAVLVGEAFRAHGLSVDAIIASPAVRVAETLALFQPAAGLSALAPRLERRVYLASSATLIEALRDRPDTAATLLLAGHNPGLEDLILDTVPADCAASAPLRAQVLEKFPTGALARLRLDCRRWADIGPGSATLDLLIRPRDLDPALGPTPADQDA